MYSLLFLGFSGFLLSLFLTAVVRNVFRRLGVVDQPDHNRKLHARPVPRVGGVAIALAYTLAFVLLFVAKLKAGLIVWEALPLIWKVFPAAILIFATGLLDDLIRLKPWQKLLGQIAAAGVAYFAGIQVVALGGKHFALWLSLPATIIWLVACANAVNLIDGIDGLAAGVALVATTTTLLAAGLQHNPELALATVPLVGCLVGFLRYNFNPATIFLGDSGSLFIGFLLGCYAVLWSEKSATILGMTAPLIALSIPLLDTSLAVARRFLRRQPIFGADLNHIHHRLLERGLTPRRAALLLYGIAAVAAIFSLSMVNNHFEVPVILIFCIAAWIGVQRLGYIEFDTAGRMLLQGSFRRFLNSHISLRNFESSLSLAKTPDECWTILKNNFENFGFHRVDMQLAGRNYIQKSDDSAAFRAWRVEIPLSERDYVHLTGQFGNNAKHTVVAPFADVLRKTLESKLPSFTPPEPPPLPPTPHAESVPERWQVASMGD
jgi:UDP-GlcNAc:undecaprenyl-phosphate GlcNAc-1-phosphate transferase